MSGSNGDRGDIGGPDVTSDADPCGRSRRGPLNSPNPAVVSGLSVGSALGVTVRTGGSPRLVAVDASGAVAGSLTFYGYLEVIDCILNRGAGYVATVTAVAGGFVEVRVDPV